MSEVAGALYRTGTVNVLQNSTTVTGVGTTWLTAIIAIAQGDLLTLDFKTWYEILAVGSDTGIILDRGFEGVDASAVNYAIFRSTSGTTSTRLAGQIAKQFNQKQLLLDEWQTWTTSENATEAITDSHNVSVQRMTLHSFEQRAEAAIDLADQSSASFVTINEDVDGLALTVASIQGDLDADKAASAASALLSQDWATKETEVDTGLESAKTYSLQSKDWATKATEVETGLESAKTYAEQAAQHLSDANIAKNAAESAMTSAEALLDSFDDSYLGPHASDPVLDNDGDALVDGMMYLNTTNNVLRFYNNSAWISPQESIVLSANTAATAASDAIDEKVLASQYANYPVNTLIPNVGEYSALHWKEQAAAIAGGAATDSVLFGGHEVVYFAPQSNTFTKAEVTAAISNSVKSPSDILAAIVTVDGTGSGLDADLLDGQEGSYYAPISSPSLIGTPTAPTADTATNTTQIATTAFVHTKVNELLGGAPDALNTLSELAAAINNDEDLGSTLTVAIAAKVEQTEFDARKIASDANQSSLESRILDLELDLNIKMWSFIV